MADDEGERVAGNEDVSGTQEEEKPSKLTQFPQTRVRNMMKLDPDLQLANKEAVFVITRAAVSLVVDTSLLGMVLTYFTRKSFEFVFYTMKITYSFKC